MAQEPEPGVRQAEGTRTASLSGEDASALRALLQNETERRKRIRTDLLLLVCAVVLSGLFGILLGYTRIRHTFFTAIGAVFGANTLVTGIQYLFFRKRKREPHYQEVSKPLAPKNLQAIRMLLTLGYQPDTVNAEPINALIALLPRLKAEDAARLSKSDRAMLYGMLARPGAYPADLQVAILKALEQIGDEKALPIVERLATRMATEVEQQTLLDLEVVHPELKQARMLRNERRKQYEDTRAYWTMTPFEQLEQLRHAYEAAEAAYQAQCDAVLHRVQRAAAACLPILRERIAAQRAGQLLLRPAEAPGPPADTLLRPAAGPGEADAERLLRPGSPPTSP